MQANAPIEMMDGIEKSINERDVRGDVPVVGNKPRRKMRETHVRRAIVDRVHCVPRCTGRSGPKCLLRFCKNNRKKISSTNHPYLLPQRRHYFIHLRQTKRKAKDVEYHGSSQLSGCARTVKR